MFGRGNLRSEVRESWERGIWLFVASQQFQSELSVAPVAASRLLVIRSSIPWACAQGYGLPPLRGLGRFRFEGFGGRAFICWMSVEAFSAKDP